MRYGDIIPLSGLRHDGRRYHEYRPIKFHLGIHATADGSCEYNQGLTKILVTTEGPKEASSGKQRMADQGYLNVFITSSAFARGERKDPRRSDKKDRLLRQMVEETLRSTLMLNLYPRSTIDVFVTILQHDAGVRSAVLNACTLALVHSGICFKDLAFSCDAKIVNDIVVADPNEHERTLPGPLMNVIQWVHSGKIVSLQMERPLSIDDHERLLTMACEAITNIHSFCSKEIENIVTNLTLRADPHGFVKTLITSDNI